MQRSQRVTLADIAARSGVSTATASMILSERPDVSFSRETVLKVREAAEALVPIDAWVDEILDNLEYRDYPCPSYKAPRKMRREGSG